MIFLPKQKKDDPLQQASFGELLKERQHLVIDCLGDSITWGMYSTPQLKEQIDEGEIETGPDDGGQMFEDVGIYVSGAFQSTPSYPEVLESDLNRLLKEADTSFSVETVNDGICGDWVTKDTYRRMTCDPDLVLLLMCGNNFYFGMPVEGMMETTIEALQKQGKTVYLVNYPLYPGERMEETFAQANQHIAMIAEKCDLPLIDVYSRMNEVVYQGEGAAPEGSYKRDALFSPDHIHLSEKGYELVGHFVADALIAEVK